MEEDEEIKEERYVLELTEEQMKVVSYACEMLARLRMGQVRIVLDDTLHLKKVEDIDWEAYHKDLDGIEKTLKGYLNTESCRPRKSAGSRAWDIYQTLRHCLSWNKAVSKGLVESLESDRDWHTMSSVEYDTPMCTAGEPLPKVAKL